MRRDDPGYLRDMLDTARKALRRIEGVAREEYDANEDLRIVLAHLIQIIGEAASHVSREFREEHPEIPWQAIVGMRHRIVHDYTMIDEDRVWDTAASDLPELVRLLEPLVPHSAE